jgi:hypothetical protein
LSTIQLSLRETRVVVERILLVAGLPAGAVAPVRDVILDAEALGLGALTYLRDSLHELEVADAARLTVDGSSTDGLINLDCHDQPAIVMAPAVLDLAVGSVHRHGLAVVRVRNVRHPLLLAGLVGSAERHSVRLVVVAPERAAELVVGAEEPGREALRCVAASGDVLVMGAPMRTAHAADPLVTLTGNTQVARATREGLSVPTELWWHLFHKSNEALSPDSPVSRQHAGASVLDADGHIVGDTDDDQDLDSARAA